MLKMKQLVEEAHKIAQLREGRQNPAYNDIANEFWSFQIKLLRQLSNTKMSSTDQNKIQGWMHEILDTIQFQPLDKDKG